MIISHKLKYVFLAVPKTGTRSVRKILLKDYNGIAGDDHSYDIPKECEDYHKFMTIRNPYARAVSTWYAVAISTKYERGDDRYGWINKAGGKNDFLSILKEFTNKNKNSRIQKWQSIPQSVYYNVGVDKVLHTENLEKDFNKLFFISEKVELPVINTTRDERKPYYEYMNDEAISLINDYYTEDFKLGNYVMYKNFEDMSSNIVEEK